MESALNELAERTRAAEQRVSQYQDLLSRFQSLIDAGQLSVSITDGRMVVQLATDILFASGSADLSEDGVAALAAVSSILAEIPERRYQIEGHTDNVPISTAQYPSNWELASARAIVVLQAMLDAGLGAERVSAASYSDTRPVTPNDSAEGRAANRRIEIVVVPDLSQLPGFEELQAVAAE
jgi:chemotaxis protein MotB